MSGLIRTLKSLFAWCISIIFLTITAGAITVPGPPTVSSIDGSGGSCIFSLTHTVTGTVDDGGGNDRYSFQGRAGNSSFRGTSYSIAVGTTETRTLTGRIPTVVIGQIRASSPLKVSVGETSGSINQLPTEDITRADLTTAGGSCATALSVNRPPVANAGPDQTMVSGRQLVSLAGNFSSDPDRDPLTYLWTQISGPSVLLTSTTTPFPQFISPVETSVVQDLVFQLIVNDGQLDSAPDTVQISVVANEQPVANAGVDQGPFNAGQTVQLDGTGSTDPDRDRITYSWSQISGTFVTLSNTNAASPTFSAPIVNANEVLRFQLIVNDGLINSNADTVQITIDANGIPIANAGIDQNSIKGGQSVTLDGSASSDPDGDTLTYNWVQTSGTSVTLTDSTAVTPSFTAPNATASAQSLTFNLIVSDGIVSSVADSVTVTILANSLPVANAGVDQGPIDSGQSVSLDGSASSDPDGDVLSYAWTQVSGTSVTLSDATAAAPGFTAPTVNGSEDLLFQLVVNDGVANSAPDTVTISVQAIGTITAVINVTGTDRRFSFSSNVSALNANVSTQNGRAQLAAGSVTAGAHTLTLSDPRAYGYAITSISCNDADSLIDQNTRSVAINLSPSEELVCTFEAVDSRSAAQAAIGQFLTARNAALLASQPAMQRRINRLENRAAGNSYGTAYGVPIPGSNKVPLQFQIASNGGRVATSLAAMQGTESNPDRATSWDIWAEAYVSDLRYADNSGLFAIGYVGADYRLNDKLLIGALFQYDSFNADEALTAGDAEGNGWMVGPYMTTRLSPNLFADVRVAWGQSDNAVSPIGTFQDNFQTDRMLLNSSLSGRFEMGRSTVIRPEVSVRYLEDKQKAYIDTLGVSIPEMSVDQGDISFAPRIERNSRLANGWSVRPFGEVEAIYTFGLEPDNVLGSEFRGRIEGGSDFVTPQGLTFNLSGFYDGVGADRFENFGLRFGISTGY